MRKEIRISGFGGQGVVLTGYVLGKALSLYEGLEAVMTQSYGPEARGGASSANVVFSETEIAYPFVQQPDVLVALSQEAYSKFRPTARQGALILIDEDLVEPDPEDSVCAIPATRLAEGLGRRIVANMIMLGYFTAVSGLVSRESMQAALESSVKPKTIELNLQAFTIGYEYTGKKEKVA
jgi:2-oxoglutarate ferredoxin oxidoreductase subunit gamma